MSHHMVDEWAGIVLYQYKASKAHFLTCAECERDFAVPEEEVEAGTMFANHVEREHDAPGEDDEEGDLYGSVDLYVTPPSSPSRTYHKFLDLSQQEGESYYDYWKAPYHKKEDAAPAILSDTGDTWEDLQVSIAFSPSAGDRITCTQRVPSVNAPYSSQLLKQLNNGATGPLESWEDAGTEEAGCGKPQKSWSQTFYPSHPEPTSNFYTSSSTPYTPSYPSYPSSSYAQVHPEPPKLPPPLWATKKKGWEDAYMDDKQIEDFAATLIREQDEQMYKTQVYYLEQLEVKKEKAPPPPPPVEPPRGRQGKEEIEEEEMVPPPKKSAVDRSKMHAFRNGMYDEEQRIFYRYEETVPDLC